MRAKPSLADQDLADKVQALGGGIWIKDTQVQAWHEYGVFEPERSFPGRGRGSVSSYPSGTADVALRFWQLVRACRSLDAATIFLFIEGHPVGEKALKRALHWAIAGAPKAQNDLHAQARDAAHRFVKDGLPATSAFRESFGLQGKELESAILGIVTSVLGYPAPVDPERKRSIPAIVRALHLEQPWKDNPAETARLLNKRLSHSTPDEIGSIIEGAEVLDLIQARDVLLAQEREVLGTTTITIDERAIPPERRKLVASLLGQALIARMADAISERETVQL